MLKTVFLKCAAAFAVVFAFSVVAQAQTTPSQFPNIKIENFGQMDERFYRGAQPMPDDYKALADLGIKTVIDLRGDAEEFSKSAAEAAGLKYINIPMSGYRMPKDTDLNAFMQLANSDATGPFYVHCKAGKHRTGVAGAVYRFTKYGWDYDKVYAEMKKFDFSTGLLHGSFKTYVKDYAKRMKSSPEAAAQAN